MSRLPKYRHDDFVNSCRSMEIAARNIPKIDRYKLLYGSRVSPAKEMNMNRHKPHKTYNGVTATSLFVDEFSNWPIEEKKVNYTFNVTSNKAINFEEIAKELSSTNPVLLVSCSEIKGNAEKQVEKDCIKDLKIMLIDAKKAGSSTACVEIKKEIQTTQRKLDREYFILLHPKLAQKIDYLAAEDIPLTDVLHLSDFLNTNEFDDMLNIMQVEASEISTVKNFIQTIIDAPWPSGFKAEVEVKSLL